jgi:hypothetical protein
VPRRAWREVRHVGAGGAFGKGEAFQPGDGLVFCVDAARFLPPNVTITRGRYVLGLSQIQAHWLMPCTECSTQVSPLQYVQQKTRLFAHCA